MFADRVLHDGVAIGLRAGFPYIDDKFAFRKVPTDALLDDVLLLRGESNDVLPDPFRFGEHQPGGLILREVDVLLAHFLRCEEPLQLRVPDSLRPQRSRAEDKNGDNRSH